MNRVPGPAFVVFPQLTLAFSMQDRPLLQKIYWSEGYFIYVPSCGVHLRRLVGRPDVLFSFF